MQSRVKFLMTILKILFPIIEPEVAYDMAKNITGPNSITRKISSKSPEYSFRYALVVDKKPTEVTRTGVLRDAEYAYNYAVRIDRQPSPETWKIVKFSQYEEDYLKSFDVESPEKMDTIVNLIDL